MGFFERAVNKVRRNTQTCDQILRQTRAKLLHMDLLKLLGRVHDPTCLQQVLLDCESPIHLNIESFFDLLDIVEEEEQIQRLGGLSNELVVAVRLRDLFNELVLRSLEHARER